MHDYYLAFGRSLQKARVRANKTQARIAREIGIGQPAVNGWEMGQFLPQDDRFPLVAKAYEIDLSKLTQALDRVREHKFHSGADALKRDGRPGKDHSQLFSGHVTPRGSVGHNPIVEQDWTPR